MTDEEIKRMIDIRKKIQDSGEPIYNLIGDDDLRWLVGEIMGLNENVVIAFPGTIGSASILQNGFTLNQMHWIMNLNAKLNEINNSSKELIAIKNAKYNVDSVLEEIADHIEHRRFQCTQGWGGLSVEEKLLIIKDNITEAIQGWTDNRLGKSEDIKLEEKKGV